jgi:hypothetical protein
LNPIYALGFDEEPQDRDAERLEGFAVHTDLGFSPLSIIGKGKGVRRRE